MRPEATSKTYLGLFFVTLATLMLQILLTRIFSVTMWYHFAFMAVSIAMFGMTVGAILVYLKPGMFPEEKSKQQMASCSLWFSVTVVLGFVGHLLVPFLTATGDDGDLQKEGWATFLSLGLTYIIISVPFVFSGVVVCLALTRFPGRIGKLYAFDLAGAALGCVLLLMVMQWTDGPTAVIVVAGLAALAASFFALDAGKPVVTAFSILCAVGFLGFSVYHTGRVNEQDPLLRLSWIKGKKLEPPLFEKWNAFSYFMIAQDDRLDPEKPFGWGLSNRYHAKEPVRQLVVAIDAAAGTVLTEFDGEFGKLEHLKHDVTNIGHYLRGGGDALVVGVGGGRDLLSALTFGKDSVVGVEINGDLVDVLENRFADFTGHLAERPDVTLVNDEARSYIARQDKKFDFLQVSLIDTWAATAAGAFVLTENSLYTLEAWEVFLEHLTDNGILSFSRWYMPHHPSETYRLIALASQALVNAGIENPEQHILAVTNLPQFLLDGDERIRAKLPESGIGTALISKTPFTERDIQILTEEVKRQNFGILIGPGAVPDPMLEKLVSGKNLDELAASYDLDISPPTDNRPFFFNMLRLRDVFRRDLMESPVNDFNLKAVGTLGSLLLIVFLLTLLCVIVPLILTTKRDVLQGGLPYFAYFAAIGLGFMFVEISQMQRLIVFLGHPTYGLSVVLFALLVSSGIGSYLTPAVKPERARSEGWRLLVLLAVLVLFGLITPYATTAFRGETTPVRIAVAVGILLPLGLFLGMAFPLGMSLASARSKALTPWLWGINGATSVCASVVSIAISLAAGISTSFWVGVGCYIVALLAFLMAGRRATA